jgi:hypothetical protein
MKCLKETKCQDCFFLYNNVIQGWWALGIEIQDIFFCMPSIFIISGPTIHSERTFEIDI